MINGPFQQIGHGHNHCVETECISQEVSLIPQNFDQSLANGAKTNKG
jgi:hypothetical protein